MEKTISDQTRASRSRRSYAHPLRMGAVATYAALRDKVRETLLLGQQKIEEAKVQTYWNTGRLIKEHILLNKDRADYGKKVVERLSGDLDLAESVLWRCMQFAVKFQILAARRELTWAHYRALIAVPDEKKRLALADQASKEEWSSRDLEIKIRNLLWDARAEASEGQAPSLLSVPVLGPFYTYPIITPESIHSRVAEPLLDVGFSATKKLGQFTSKKLPAGTIVTSAKDSKGKYSLKIPSPHPLPEGEGAPSLPLPDGKCTPSLPLPGGEDKGEGALYTYKAYVERVIDGDTLKLEIDTGFDDQKHETIRLRGIDCPELNTKEGQAAKRFVERELAHCESIILKTTQSPRKEKWGRYLGDIFYTDRAGKQQYLNNLLIEKGYAVKVRE